MLTWNVPIRPNGVIISYEISYSVSGNWSVTENITNTTTSFIIQPLLPDTTVFKISVSAYTSIGRGIPANIYSLRSLSPAASCKYVYTTKTYKFASMLYGIGNSHITRSIFL